MSERKKGDARMRELGMRKVSFWLSAGELQLIQKAWGHAGGRRGQIAHRLLIAEAEKVAGVSLQQIRDRMRG